MKNEIKISEVIGHFLQLKQTENKILVGLCPFHPDTRPHFVVDDSTNNFYCEVCEARGDSLNFVMRFKAVTSEEAQGVIQDISKMSDKFYSSTRTGKMKIRDGVTAGEISDEVSELWDFISSIEHAPEWRDVSLTEHFERTRAVIEALSKAPDEERLEMYGQLLRNFLKLTRISYQHEFGHAPYCDMGSDEVHRWMNINQDRIRKESNPVVQFVAKIFRQIGKFLGIR